MHPDPETPRHDAAHPLLFIGDSITDCGRLQDPGGLGTGYVRLIAEHLAAYEPTARVLNRGISGDRVRDLQARFTVDCLDLDPAVVTIYIGVNDTWRRYDANDPTSLADFTVGYRFLLDQLSATRPAVSVILVLPVVTDVDEDRARFHKDLDEKVAAIRTLAREFSCEVVDLEDVIARALASGHTPASLAPDGVHPSLSGHRLIADAWIRAYERARHHR